jgi:hypothetical protein
MQEKGSPWYIVRSPAQKKGRPGLEYGAQLRTMGCRDGEGHGEPGVFDMMVGD